MRKLGKTQKDVLDSLQRHKMWSEKNCGWIWSTPSKTKKLMDSLVRAGFATKTVESGREIYRPLKETP